MTTVRAPWTDEQVESLNGWQNAGYVHPFTSENGETLIATKGGWVEKEGGPVVQDWAHDFMADGRWKRATEWPKDVLSMWTIYKKPKDYPTKFVARRWAVNREVRRTDDVRVADSLEAVRALLPAGLFRLDRDLQDDPNIVETWL